MIDKIYKMLFLMKSVIFKTTVVIGGNCASNDVKTSLKIGITYKDKTAKITMHNVNKKIG